MVLALILTPLPSALQSKDRRAGAWVCLALSVVYVRPSLPFTFLPKPSCFSRRFAPHKRDCRLGYVYKNFEMGGHVDCVRLRTGTGSLRRDGV